MIDGKSMADAYAMMLAVVIVVTIVVAIAGWELAQWLWSHIDFRWN